MGMKNLDLNLLPQLQVLLELRNVSRAAERLQLSQPATSAAMARLIPIKTVTTVPSPLLTVPWRLAGISSLTATAMALEG